MSSKDAELIQDLLITLHANIHDLRERKSFADPEELNYIEGKLQAYSEILNAIRSSDNDVDLGRDDQ